ncbi:AEC family transporter [Aquabacterium sp. J223]|uniref:AEC family transporter n=1 Tax=Aquabacterium sp. J223 TaxID=2898431 RepID=UPI0021AD5F2F|nr:AEC family transporter [Aquabacterium sp. J223]UUX96098.1 AEC family transporter [Aquabacterium sp. J223]
MVHVLAVTAPFFALVLIGWWAARRGVVPAAAVPGLNGFVLFFALPCMLMRFGMATPLERLLDPWVLAVYALAMGPVVALALWALRRRGWPRADAAFGALVAAFPNSGFMGVPLLVALLGPQAAGPVICTLLVDFFLTSSLCLALARAPGAGEGRGAAAWAAFKAAAGNPLPWAIAVGALLRATGTRLPGPLDATVQLLGDAASPVALFTIGVVLWTTAGTGAGVSNGRRTDALPAAALKLALHPALVLGLGLAARAAGAPLSGFALMVLVLTAALPSASNVSLLAQARGADIGRVARIIMASTVAAFASFSAWAWAFGVGR